MMRISSFRPAFLAGFGAWVLAGCAVPPTPSADQTSIVSRLPSDYAYTVPVQAAPPPAVIQTPAPTPALTEQERQRYAEIDKQVQREQVQSMAAYEAARYAYYYPQPLYYAPPVVVGGYYGGYYGGYGRYGYPGCCWGGGPRWSVGIGYSTGWGW
ncbi:hypothetical protein [Pararobbsia alpina]|uniref:Lipoprotein n=1 Tax=Pararobbsia alpina TaxID=621374 RepID=A0A6S7B8Y2_9BURK|nr:hypothetical protein [Pararobbsia alpina]CAB3783207.1 hypothetical protein LMG28138_01593 [Pararobbsia alpina]